MNLLSENLTFDLAKMVIESQLKIPTGGKDPFLKRNLYPWAEYAMQMSVCICK